MRSRLVLSSALAAALLLGGLAPAALAQNSSQQVGLVNVSTGDVDILNGVNIGVAANVIATVCDATVPIALLATQIIVDDGATFCSTEGPPITITQSGPGDAGGTPNGLGGNNSRQAGLVNVSLGDVAILNDVNLALAVNVLATVCDLTVPVAVLAVQAVSDTGPTGCVTDAGPIVIDQAA